MPDSTGTRALTFRFFLDFMLYFSGTNASSPAFLASSLTFSSFWALVHPMLHHFISLLSSVVFISGDKGTNNRIKFQILGEFFPNYLAVSAIYATFATGKNYNFENERK